MSRDATAALVEALLDEVGQLADPSAESEVHRASVGPYGFVLRRDCHGVLRKMEMLFPRELRGSVRERLGEGGWLTISPGELDLLDLAHVGKVYLLSDRLNIAFRMNIARQALSDMVLRCAGISPLTPAHPAQ